MNRHLNIRLLVAIAAMYALPALAEDVAKATPDTFMDSVKEGKNLTSFRLRYENVGQDGNAPVLTPARPLKDANALTLRSLIGWQTAPYNNFSFAAQLINVSKLDDDFNDSTPLSGPLNSASNQPSKLAYAKVVDPDYTGINQLYIDWTGIKNTKFRLGRQQVNLDNVRFIGDIGFRQVMQVFDGASVLNKSIPDTEVYLAHFESVRQINTKLRTDGALEVANIKYYISPSETLVGYGYLSSFDDLGFGNAWFGAGSLNNGTKPNISADQGNKTFGLRLDGVHKLNDDWKAIYTAEYAKQTDYSGGDSRIDADYYKIGGGAGYGSFSLRVDQELLGSNNGQYAFQTPFGTNHLFQGWVDKFLATPKEGIRDSFITANYKYNDFMFFVDYHVFNSDVDFYKVTGGKGDKYGTEWNAAVTYSYSKNITTKVEYGHYYESDQYQPTAAVTQASRIRDTDKLWLTAMYSF
jgi:hypothetical protein